MMWHTYNPKAMSLPIINFHTLWSLWSRSLRQGQRPNQGHTMMLHTYTPQSMSLPSMNFIHLTVSEIQPRQTFSPTALKGYGVKILGTSILGERRPPLRPNTPKITFVNKWNDKSITEKLMDWDDHLEHHQNHITSFLCYWRHFLKISWKSIHNFFHLFCKMDNWTSRHECDQNITSLVEVIQKFLVLFKPYVEFTQYSVKEIM